jgi:hypothetical protein
MRDNAKEELSAVKGGCVILINRFRQLVLYFFP